MKKKLYIGIGLLVVSALVIGTFFITGFTAYWHPIVALAFGISPSALGLIGIFLIVNYIDKRKKEAICPATILKNQ